MTTRDVGDRLNLQHLVYNASGTLTNATVALTVTAPDGTTSTPTVTNASTGTYTAAFTLSSAGVWSWVWTVSGTVVDVDQGSVLAANPGPAVYASLPELKAELRITDTTEDLLLNTSLVSASRAISRFCQRTFGQATTASARTFEPDSYCWTNVDDFWTTSGLIIKTGTDGTYTTTQTTYELDPANGLVDGEPGWPYWKIRPVGWTFPCGSSYRRTLEVTAKWGWPSIPETVKRMCLQLAMEDFKMTGAPFGVAGTDQFGPIRVRPNSWIADQLTPYRRYPVLVG